MLMLFYDQKPTKKIELGGGDYVVLKPLSTLAKDQHEAEIVDIRQECIEKTEKIEVEPEKFETKITYKPGGQKKMVLKCKELDYEKISNSIESWSGPDEVTLENVKRLDEKVRDRLLAEIEKYNSLSEDEIKN